MKIRELRLRHFRNVGETLRTISFADEATGLVRPLTVLVGSNGSGKSSVFEVIEGLLSFAIGKQPSIVQEARRRPGYYVAASVEFSKTAPHPLPEGGWLTLKHKDHVPEDGSVKRLSIEALNRLRQWVEEMTEGPEPVVDGLLHFPHDRWIKHLQSGPIAPPPERVTWLFRFRSSDNWGGSLSQLWVWQNYLDLERQAEGRENLAPFVAVVEEVLGEEHQIRIREGQVRIVRPRLGDEVGPHQLPSG